MILIFGFYCYFVGVVFWFNILFLYFMFLVFVVWLCGNGVNKELIRIEMRINIYIYNIYYLKCII